MNAGITAPEGFLFAVAEAAIKKPGRKDMALIYSPDECTMAGMFTRNRVRAAPVIVDRRRIRSGRGKAIVVNSGNANACTGKQGMRDAEEMTRSAADVLSVQKSEVYVCSTGVIGVPLPMDRVREGIRKLGESVGKAGIGDVAQAIMTTDTFPKVSSRSFNIGKMTITIAGICKGAGMIAPDMATMLAFIVTDASIEKEALGAALRESVHDTFNAITVDGDMSTNDTILIAANGKAKNSRITANTKAGRDFTETLHGICEELARMIVRDGEGATKTIEIRVRNARSSTDAKKGALTVANSPLVKTAIYGNDANWGRIVAALGRSGIMLKESLIDIGINGLTLVKGGLATGIDREANEILKGKEILIDIDLQDGNAAARVLTCDLTEDYIRINAEYRT